MALKAVRQRRFDGGEIAPALHLRNDIEAFGSSVAEMLNFFPQRHGKAVSRPGMERCGVTKHITLTSPRLIRFVLTQDVAYVLEVGHHYMRFWKDRELQGAPYEVATPWTLEHARELKVAQLAGSMVLAHPSYTPRELVLVDTDPIQFTLSEIDYVPPTYQGSEPLIVAPFYVHDDEHPLVEWRWALTNVMRRADGTVYETLPYLVNRKVVFALGATGRDVGTFTPSAMDGFKHPLFIDMPMEIDFDLQEGVNLPQDEFLGTYIYRGRGNIFGLVGRVLGVPDSDGEGGHSSQYDDGSPDFTEQAPGDQPWRFVDYGQDPDYTHSPPQGRNPFEVTEDDVTRVEDPACCCYFEQRLVFARTDERPNWIWMSATNNFTDFDEYVEPLDEDGIEHQIASLEYEEIRALVPRDHLFVFTSAGVYTFGTADGEPLSPVGRVQARRVSPVGSSLLQPISMPNALLYERAMGGGVRDMAYSNERGGYHDGDLSFLAEHLFDGHRIVAWDYAEVPWGLIWAVRDDGKLLSLLYDRVHGLVGWSLHETEGFIEDVCVVPEGDQHAVYLSVGREGTQGVTEIQYSVERFTNRKIEAVEDAVCLDAAVSFTEGPYAEITIPEHLRNATYSYLADGAAYGPFEGDGSETLTLPTEPTKVHIGLAFTPRLKTLDLMEARTQDKLVKRYQLEIEGSAGIFVGEPEHDNVDEEMKEVITRSVEDDYAAVPLQTLTTPTQSIKTRWNLHGQIAIEQRAPLPLTILGITREYETGRP